MYRNIGTYIYIYIIYQVMQNENISENQVSKNGGNRSCKM